MGPARTPETDSHFEMIRCMAFHAGFKSVSLMTPLRGENLKLWDRDKNVEGLLLQATDWSSS